MNELEQITVEQAERFNENWGLYPQVDADSSKIVFSYE